MQTVPGFSGYVEFSAGFAPRPAITHVLFDFDGTLSLVRSGWQAVMRAMFLEALEPLTPDEPPLALAQQAEAAIDRLTGQATLVQMAWLAEQVAARGGQADPPAAYKARFAARLAGLVVARLEALRTGELSPDQLLVPGARALLEGLRERGVRLALASGTDRAEVLAEAQALGVAGFFGERIYGPGRHAPGFSKRAAIDMLLAEAGLPGGRLLALGDGPVEIADARAVGGVAVGVAFDEARRAGVDPLKRARLIAAGADLIVDDFQQHDDLLEIVLNSD